MRARLAIALLVVVGLFAGSGFAAPGLRQRVRIRLAQLTFTTQMRRRTFRLLPAIAVSISYHVANAQNGTIVVTDTSATAGPPPHIVRIPVRLSP